MKTWGSIWTLSFESFCTYFSLFIDVGDFYVSESMLCLSFFIVFVLIYRDFESFFMLLCFTSRFAFLYFQILSHICDFLNQRCFLRSKRMRWRGMKLGVFMEPCWWDSLLIQSLYDSTLMEVLSWICVGVTRPCFCQHAAGQCIYDLLKMFPPLTSLPAHAVWKSNARVTTTVPSKKYTDFFFIGLIWIIHLNLPQVFTLVNVCRVSTFKWIAIRARLCKWCLRFLCNTRIGHTFMVTSIFKGQVVSS